MPIRRQRERAERERTVKAGLRVIARLSRRESVELRQRAASISNDIWQAAEKRDTTRKGEHDGSA